MSHARTVELSWAGRVRTGSKKMFDYEKDYEVTCRFKDIFSREEIYKEVQKANWPFTKIVGMVLRPGGLVDFNLRPKELALKFAKVLNDLESVKNATAHADMVVEVQIDFIPPGFPSEPIIEYLTHNHGEILDTPIPLSESRTDITFKQGQEFSKWTEKNYNRTQYQVISTLANINSEPAIKDNLPPVATVPKTIT